MFSRLSWNSLDQQDDLEEWARRAKKDQMALRAARLAQKTPAHAVQTDRKHLAGKGRAGGNGRGKKRKRKQDTDLAGVLGSQSEASAESFVFSEEEVEQFEQKEMQCLSKAPSRPVQRRSEAIKAEAILAWGPFFLAPIVPAGGQTGWGAICNMHLDEHDSGHTGCKKSVSLSICGNSHQECILRLKRWLLAGLDDEAWPKHRMRSHRSNGRQRHGGFRRRLNRGRAGHTA